jgi:hypothetical protein
MDYMDNHRVPANKSELPNAGNSEKFYLMKSTMVQQQQIGVEKKITYIMSLEDSGWQTPSLLTKTEVIIYI